MTKKAQRQQEYERHKDSLRTLISYGDHAKMTAELREELTAAQSRVKELEQRVEGLDAFAADANSRYLKWFHKCTAVEKANQDLIADNARLRELLRECAGKWSLQVAFKNGELLDRIKAEIESQ